MFDICRASNSAKERCKPRRVTSTLESVIFLRIPPSIKASGGSELNAYALSTKCCLHYAVMSLRLPPPLRGSFKCSRFVCFTFAIQSALALALYVMPVDPDLRKVSSSSARSSKRVRRAPKQVYDNDFEAQEMHDVRFLCSASRDPFSLARAARSSLFFSHD